MSRLYAQNSELKTHYSWLIPHYSEKTLAKSLAWAAGEDATVRYCLVLCAFFNHTAPSWRKG